MRLNSKKYNLILIAFLMLFFVACQKGDEPVPFSSQNEGAGVFSSQRIGDIPLDADSADVTGSANGASSDDPLEPINDGKVIGGDDNEDDDDLDNGVGNSGGGKGGSGVGGSNWGGGV